MAMIKEEVLCEKCIAGGIERPAQVVLGRTLLCLEHARGYLDKPKKEA